MGSRDGVFMKADMSIMFFCEVNIAFWTGGYVCICYMVHTPITDNLPLDIDIAYPRLDNYRIPCNIIWHDFLVMLAFSLH